MINRQFTLLFTLFVILSATAISLQAHTELLDAEPAAGDMLTIPPTAVRLTFNEALSPGSDLFLFTEGFQYVDDVTVTVPSDRPEQLIATFSTLPPETYTVQWTAVSEDGHTITGSYTFEVLPPAQSRTISTVMFVLVGVLIVSGILFVLRRSRMQ